MTFDDWYKENERRIYIGHMSTREAVMAGWYGARESERERCAKIAETLYDVDTDIPFDIPADDMGRLIATAIRNG